MTKPAKLTAVKIAELRALTKYVREDLAMAGLTPRAVRLIVGDLLKIIRGR